MLWVQSGGYRAEAVPVQNDTFSGVGTVNSQPQADTERTSQPDAPGLQGKRLFPKYFANQYAEYAEHWHQPERDGVLGFKLAARNLDGKDSVLWMQSGEHWAEAVPVQKPPSAEPEPSIRRAEIWHGDEPLATGRGAGGEWRSPIFRKGAYSNHMHWTFNPLTHNAPCDIQDGELG